MCERPNPRYDVLEKACVVTLMGRWNRGMSVSLYNDAYALDEKRAFSPVEIILTHDNSDFDAVAALVAATKLNPAAVAVLPERLNHNVGQFLSRYRDDFSFIHLYDIRASEVTRITIVDTQRSIQIKGVRAATPMHIIDHHPLARKLQAQQTFTSEAVGAVTTLLVEQIRAQNIAISPVEATLFALGIYEDTGSLVYGSTLGLCHS